MADEKELKLDNPGKKKKLIIIIAIVAVLAIASGVAAFFIFGGDNDISQAEIDAALDTGAKNEKVEGAELGSALYVPMPRHFRFNAPGAARDRFVEIRVQLLVRGIENEETAKKHVPLIESALLGVFSTSNADDLATSAGKISLKQKSLVAVQKIMAEIEGSAVVEKVLFTGFVMQ
ncbi:flagellar basal body-associated protein FliL [Colwellia sp. MB02u-6]|jgi:flagellar FliL protein|uniref:flagellar basal body-associated protein FliL n=1 Tax=Colwellia sp. MB02u-6 TaxID=2759824 RepID=UPI0015F4925C|nr:flagellar basal body-associated protein FliL [Colwellia sp. MB02u-6]MBA6326972.1 flagellar basal body-associated protein FliL [Colwellia sp. MB02u-6]